MSLLIQEGLGVEPMLLHEEPVEVAWARWLGTLLTTMRRPRGRCWRDNVSQLTWELLGIPVEELAQVARERESFIIFHLNRWNYTLKYQYRFHSGKSLVALYHLDI